MQGEWVRNEAKYASGEVYKIGKIKVGAWFNPTVRKGDPTIYRAMIELPGISMNGIDFDNAEKARERVERAVKTWFRWLEEKETVK